LVYILEHLNSEDRFNVVTFSTGIESFAPNLVPISYVSDAIGWVGRTSAVGSTDINRALLEAASVVGKERPTYLIFLTDGLPTEGVIDSQMIINNLNEIAPSNLRLFTFGVGYDVDTYLLDTLAQDHHGTSTYIFPGEQLDEILSSFYEKISSPVLTNIELIFEDLGVYDVYPSPLPDLFVGSQLVVVGRYRDSGVTAVTLKGLVNGEIEAFEYRDQILVDSSAQSASETSIPRLWATRKIGYLLNKVRLGGPDQETINQIVHLSIRYGIVTPYTSYLVTEPTPLGADEQERIAREQFAEMEAQLNAPTSGRDAVELAAGEGALKEADMATEPSEQQANKFRIVGSRTYILSDNVWVDTAYDPDMETVKIAFLSDNYFNLLAKHPDIGSAYALGPQVITLVDGIAYQVVPVNPEVGQLEVSPTNLPFDESTPGGSEMPILEKTVAPDEILVSPSSPRKVPCLGGLLLIFVPLLVVSRLRDN
jgi:Ca-activated chloride channel family protein